jgi:hypothetical protein
MLKYILFLTLIVINSLAFDFTAHEDFSAFEGRPVVALWRGTYFSPTYFKTEQDRRSYLAAHGVQVPIYCAAAHKKTNISYTQSLTPLQQTSLERTVSEIQTVFRRLETSPQITIDRRAFMNPRHAFHQRYSNSTDFIHALGQDTLPTSYIKYVPVLAGLPKGNPCLSFTTDSGHAGSYGYGLKDYGHIGLIDSLYDEMGHRRVTHIGHLQGVLLTDETARQTMPYDVVKHHDHGDIKISTHFSNNILAEGEVTFIGKMGGSAVVLTMPLELPDLAGDYPAEYREKFGLTKRKYDNIHDLVTDRRTSQEKKGERITKMLKEIISPTKEDDGLVYKNTLIYKARAAVDTIFEEFHEHVPGVIGLDGRVHDAARYG